MSLNYEMARYTELTGEDGTKVSISRLGGYLDGYEKGMADAFNKLYNEVNYIEATYRSMLLNTSQEKNLIEWVELNGKTNAVTTIKNLIQDKLEELEKNGEN